MTLSTGEEGNGLRCPSCDRALTDVDYFCPRCGRQIVVSTFLGRTHALGYDDHTYRVWSLSQPEQVRYFGKTSEGFQEAWASLVRLDPAGTARPPDPERAQARSSRVTKRGRRRTALLVIAGAFAGLLGLILSLTVGAGSIEGRVVDWTADPGFFGTRVTIEVRNSTGDVVIPYCALWFPDGRGDVDAFYQTADSNEPLFPGETRRYVLYSEQRNVGGVELDCEEQT